VRLLPGRPEVPTGGRIPWITVQSMHAPRLPRIVDGSVEFRGSPALRLLSEHRFYGLSQLISHVNGLRQSGAITSDRRIPVLRSSLRDVLTPADVRKRSFPITSTLFLLLNYLQDEYRLVKMDDRSNVLHDEQVTPMHLFASEGAPCTRERAENRKNGAMMLKKRIFHCGDNITSWVADEMFRQTGHILYAM
jgi:hypothetical protein